MNICVYGAASKSIDKKYIREGEKLGEKLHKRLVGLAIDGRRLDADAEPLVVNAGDFAFGGPWNGLHGEHNTVLCFLKPFAFAVHDKYSITTGH